MKQRLKKINRFSIPILAASLLTVSGNGQAFKFRLGEIDASFDSSISIGASWRTEDIKEDNVSGGNYPGGIAQSSTNDDGDLNFEKDQTFSKIIKGVHDLELRYKNFGAFTRFKYWYDAELAEGEREHGHPANNYKADAELNDDNFSDLSQFSGAEVLDAFLYGSFHMGDVPVDARLGKQVVSWGESTFIGNSINVINPVDVNAFRRPGAEIKEGLLPVNMAYISMGLSPEITLEAFYQFEWEKTQLDPCGTYFSTSDLIADGCEILTLGTSFPDAILVSVPSGFIPRSEDLEADDSGQYGVALRYYSEALNDTEFGFYYINYHSRIPIFSLSTVGGTPSYYAEFPEDIKLFGISFNTNLGSFAVYGEVSHRKDAPLQINASDMVTGFLGALGAVPVTTTFTPRVVLGQRASGFDRVSVTQAQISSLKTINHLLGSDRLVMIGEIGYTYIHDDLSDHPYGRSTNYGLGNPGDDGFVSKNSWGYRLRGTLEYSDVYGGINLAPGLSFAHDVNGYSPTGGAFNEGNKALSFSVNGDYQKSYRAGISYTRYFGGDFNTLADRDFMAATLGVSF
ncbi:MAG: DUF1302 domain-containing protein [Pseudomonadales bacterium]|nr:DUF1302 domain-containing protein [Pseudomonadales bacterium]